MTYDIAPETALKLIAQARRFAADRVAVRRRREAYRRDFLEGAQRRRTEMWQELEDRYREGAPDLRHLVHGSDGALLWGRRDIAIVLGRDESTMLRTLRDMRADADFSRRLAEVEVTDGGYREEVFDVVLDYYEQSYIRRFTRPRSGHAQNGPLLDYWNWLRANPDASDDEALERVSLKVSPKDLPAENEPVVHVELSDTLSSRRRNYRQALGDISLRTCSLRVGTLFVVLYAMYYEMAQTFPAIVPVVPFLCLAAVLASLWMLHGGRWPGFDPASLGAGAVLFLILWAAGVAFGLRHEPIANRDPLWQGAAWAIGGGALVCLGFVAAGIFLNLREKKRDDWSPFPEVGEETAPVAVMPKSERAFCEKFGSREWLRFSWCPGPEELPQVLRVDFSPVAGALKDGEISRAWWGVNGAPSVPLTAGCESAEIDARGTDFKAVMKFVAGERFDDDEFHYVSLLFELPDGTRVGPARFPVTALRSEAMSEQSRAIYSDWGEREVLQKLEDQGVVVTLLRGKTDGTVNMTIQNENPAPIAHAIFSLESESKTETDVMEEPFVRVFRELHDLPSGASVAEPNIFADEAMLWRNSSGGSFCEWLKGAKLTLLVASPHFGDTPSAVVPGLTGKVILRETLGLGHDRVLLEIVNETGRRIDGFKSCLEAYDASGKFFARAAQTREDERGEALYRGSKIYMTYVFRALTPPPPDAQFTLRFLSLTADPPILLTNKE